MTAPAHLETKNVFMQKVPFMTVAVILTQTNKTSPLFKLLKMKTVHSKQLADSATHVKNRFS